MAKSSDEIKELQRSINRLQRSDGAVLHLGGRPYLVQVEAVVDPDGLLELLMSEEVPEAEALDGLARSCRLESPARPIDGRWLGALQRDLKVLETRPDLAELTREAPRRFRGQVLDRGWMAARRAQLVRLQDAFARGPEEMRSLWEAALALMRCFHGDVAARELEGIRERSTRLSADRRRETLERIDRLVLRLEGGAPAGEEPPLDALLEDAAQQLRRAEQLPGRARRKRLRRIVAAVLAWPGEPGLPATGEPEIDLADSLVQQMRSLAAWRIAQQGSTRSPEFQERLVLCLSRYGLSFPPGPPGLGCALRFDEPLLELAERRWSSARTWLAGLPLRLEQVVDLLTVRYPDGADGLFESRLAIAGRWVADGLEVPLLHEAARLRLLKDLVARDWDSATARSYCRWVSKLAPHYQREGIQLALTPGAFARLRAAKQEELAVLGLCLLEHHTPAAGAPSSRQIALLDATLALFQKLPDNARRCLEGIEMAPAGLGARVCPDLAAWLEHDPGLDRYLHLCSLLGLPAKPSRNLLRDFELAARRRAELTHLAALAEPNDAQRERIARLSTATPPPGPGWTKRRLAERNEALSVELLERRIDQVLAEVLHRAYGLSLDRITPAWRDVFRFYLSTGRNQELLGLLLRNATARPGRYFPPSLPANREWLRKAAGRMNVEGWLRPRRRSVELDGRRFTLEVEEDPVEVLRMGIPFNTCLSLEDGSNAAATVLNALDVNKRVLYLRDTGGALVARQLIAVSRDFTFLSYRLYAAQDLPDLGQAFRDLREEIAREAGLPLADRGEPERLHDGFWYDDGVQPFAEKETLPVPVEEYCRRFLGLPAPPEPSRWLWREAELWAALCARDARRFAATEGLWMSRDSHSELAARLVRELGIDKLTRLYRSGVQELLPVLLWHWEEQGAEALLRAARRLGLSSVEARSVCEMLWSLPLGPAAAQEMAGLGADLLRSSPLADEHGIEHGSMGLLPRCLGAMNLAQLLDVCDRLAPVWERVVREEPGCSDCRASAEIAVLATAEGVFLRDPDTRLVVACLKSRRRGDLARRIALRILGRFPFPRQMAEGLRVSAIRAPEPALADAPWVRKALGEVAVRHPALGRSPEMLAACLRQGASVDFSTWSVPDEPPFQVLGDLILHVPELAEWLAEHFDDADQEAHFTEAERLHEARQVIWRERGELADAEASSHPELARALEVLSAPDFHLGLWVWWLAELRELTGGVLGPLLLDVIAKGVRVRSSSLARMLSPDLTLWLWSFPSLQEPLLGALSEASVHFEIGRLYLALREEARVRSIDPQDLLERWVLVLLRCKDSWELPHAGNREFLHLMIRTALAHTGPKDWFELYYGLHDHLAAALFLRELEKVPAGQRQELRGLLKPVKEDWQKPYHFWLEQALAGSSTTQSRSPDRRMRSARQRPDSRRISSRSR